MNGDPEPPSADDLLASLDAVIAREEAAVAQRTRDLVERERRRYTAQTHAGDGEKAPGRISRIRSRLSRTARRK